MAVWKKLAAFAGMVFMLGSCAKKVEVPEKPTAASLLPERVLGAYLCDDLEKLREGAKQSAMQKMLEDEEIKGFIAGIQEAVEKLQGEAGAGFTLAPEKQKELEALGAGRFALALVDVRVKGDVPEMDLFCYAGVKSVEKARELAEELLGKIPPGETERGKYVEGAVEVETISSPEVPLIFCWAYVGNRVVAALGKESMRHALERLNEKGGPSLADSPRFQKAVADLDEDAGVVYADVSAVIETAMRELGAAAVPEDVAPKVDAALDVLGLKGLETVAFSLGYSGEATVEKAFAAALEPRKGLPGLFAPGNLGDAVKKLAPKDSHSVTAVRMKLSGILPLFRGFLTAVDPEEVPAFEKDLREAGQGLGFDIEKDIAGALGDEVLVIGGPLAGGGPFGVLTRNAVAVRIKDHAAFSRAYGAVMALVTAQLGAGGEGQPTLTSFQCEGYACNAINIPVPIVNVVAPTFCLTEDYLIASADTVMMKQVLRVGAGGMPSLLDNPDFVQAAPKSSAPDSVCLRYVDWKATVAGVMPLVQMAVGFIPPQFQQQFGISPALFPPGEAVTQYLFSEGGRGTADAEGFHYGGRSPLAGSVMAGTAGVAVVAAIAIPSLLGARITSNEAMAAACLRTYAGAQNMYRRSDYDNDLIFEYAYPYSLLNTTVAGGHPIRLIDDAFAKAFRDNPPGGVTVPKAGYVFIDLVADEGGQAYAPDGENYVAGYGLCAVPEVYNRTGRNTFVINIQGIVYQKDLGHNRGVPGNVFPDVEEEGWILLGGR